jgi:protein phosphatase
MKLVGAGLSDVGRERDHNEDSYALEDALGLYIVCDGMGGHQAGEVASALAIATVVEYVREREGGDRTQVLSDAVRQANTRVIEEGNRNRRRKGMGSTLVAMIQNGEHTGIVHVGDSRCYQFRGGVLRRMTRDHSLIEELAGDDPIAHAALGGYSNVITRAIGTSPDTEPSVRDPESLVPGDLYLLCSDGLSGVVKEQEITRILHRQPDLEQCCRELIQAANDGGGPDNISTILVRVEA